MKLASITIEIAVNILFSVKYFFLSLFATFLLVFISLNLIVNIDSNYCIILILNINSSENQLYFRLTFASNISI